jgi:ferredoxin
MILRKYFGIILLALSLLLYHPFDALYACGGKDVIFTEDISSELTKRKHQSDDEGNLLFHPDEAYISAELAYAIAEKFVREKVPEQPLPITFRKLEKVHGKLVYQFQSEPLSNYNGMYHLGPVNFKVERLVLDVDAVTGDLYLATGCGAAPGKRVYQHDSSDFQHAKLGNSGTFISNNTNFIARKTGNRITLDGRIFPEEWKDTGHRYFYLGTYKPHKPSEPHQEAYYYAEVWTQIDDNNIYFAVKTDNPYWVGLMFKDNPNLGMLGSYRDAKVMKSDGEVTDRYFTQRENKTFHLAIDEKDNIIAKGNFQDVFYTYEFAFPLKTSDSQDVSFEVGKAYNMLLVIGNTFEHHGIFTLEKSHANHDHSKNNEEHVDVWASNETTFRIGEPATRDIYGNIVASGFTNFDSGYDLSKTGNHFHYAGVSLKDFKDRSLLTGYASWLSVIVGFIGLGIVLGRLRSPSENNTPQNDTAGFDLMKINCIRRFFTWKYFRYVFIIPMLILSIVVVYFGFYDIQDGKRNIATIFTWTLWWTLIIFTFIIAGRFWCMMCPFAFLGDLAQKVISLNKKLPHWLRNMGFQIFAFILLTWAFTVMAFSSKPMVTAVVILFILIAALVFSMIYQRRSFCRHFCPIGAVIGVYSMVSPIELRVGREGRCAVHKQKTCDDACPMLESPYQMDNNVYCNFCMQCQPACPSSNLILRLRTFGKDIYASLRKSPIEAFAALFLLGVVIVETLTMTSSWMPLETTVSSLLGMSSSSIPYTIIFSLVILVPVGVFYLICYLLRMWLDKEKYQTQDLLKEFAFIFIPLGIALHFAHNIQHLLIEGPIVFPATLRFLQNIGIGTSLSINWNPLPLMGLKPIFFIQMSILIAGFGFTFFVMYRLFKRIQKPIQHVYKMAIVMSLYAFVIVLSSIYMLGLPMSGRHVH